MWQYAVVHCSSEIYAPGALKGKLTQRGLEYCHVPSSCKCTADDNQKEPAIKLNGTTDYVSRLSCCVLEDF